MRWPTLLVGSASWFLMAGPMSLRRYFLPSIAPRLLCVSTGPNFATHHVENKDVGHDRHPSLASRRAEPTFTFKLSNYEQIRNSPSGHPKREKELWFALSQPVEHPPNAAHALAWSRSQPAATGRILSVSPFRRRHLRSHPVGGPLYRSERLSHRGPVAGLLGAIVSLRARPLCGLRLRSLRPRADDASQPAQPSICLPVVRTGQAGNGHAPLAALCRGVARQRASVEAR